MRMGLGSTGLAALLLASAAPAAAQSVEATRHYEIPAGPLDRALREFARQSGQQILYPAALVAGRRSPGLSGDYGPESALAALLRDTGLVHRRSRPNVFILHDAASAGPLDEAAQITELEAIVVTGSYIRGASSPSPVTVLTRDDMDRRGMGTVAGALAALPQNFAGAAHEGSSGTGADRSFSNIAYATGLNLRGLGADATLVLVNGRRLSGTGVAGDFADISSIPASAVQRVDVLLDGASALYGPDVAEEIMSNCAVEVAFAPKELKTARDLSERLGAYTYAALSRNRPAMLGAGRRSITQSDQRRSLMLPQELMQMNADALIVLKAGLPPILGRKLRFFSHPELKRRPVAPPDVPPIPASPAPRLSPAPPSPGPAPENDDWSFEGLVRSLKQEGAPLTPGHGADEAQVAAWVDALIDHAAAPRDRAEGRG